MESASRQKRILLFKRKKILTKITFRLKYPNRMCKWGWMCRCVPHVRDVDMQIFGFLGLEGLSSCQAGG
jgi:hypothetical protein